MHADSRLEGRRAVITGGGSGIGAAIGRAFAQAGARVVLAGRRVDALGAVVRDIGDAAFAAPCDITVESDVAALFAQAEAMMGGIDVLVNSAGAFTGGRIDTMELTEWERVMSVNVTGMFLCSREAFRAMLPLGKGRIINIGSLAGSRAREGSIAYTTSKHAVQGLTQALALDGRDHGISVSCLNPGNTAVERRSNGRATTGTSDVVEPLMAASLVAELAVTMAAMPEHATLLEATILPVMQPFIGRG